MNLLELEARVPNVLAEQAIRLLSGLPDLRRELAIRRPRSAASRAISQLIGIELRGSAGGSVSPGLGRELAQSVL